MIVGFIMAFLFLFFKYAFLIPSPLHALGIGPPRDYYLSCAAARLNNNDDKNRGPEPRPGFVLLPRKKKTPVPDEPILLCGGRIGRFYCRIFPLYKHKERKGGGQQPTRRFSRLSVAGRGECIGGFFFSCYKYTQPDF